MPKLSRRRRALYAAVVTTLTAVLAVALLTAADIYVHWRTQDLGGVNVWGYRGAPAPRKSEGEIRVVMLGGSTVFGWGLPADESIAAFLSRRLNAAGKATFSVINLGAPGQGAYGFLSDLSDYEYLRYDVVCLYEGYNDLGPNTVRGQNNFLLWRRESPVFRLTGYLPILPIALQEKADQMTGRTPGNERAHFQPGLTTRVTAGALHAVARATNGLTSSFATTPPVPEDASVDTACADPWQHYCGSVRSAIEWSVARGKSVVFATQPYVSDLHRDQQANVEAMLRARFGNDPRVRYVNLGAAIDMTDQSIAYDGLHLVARGNDLIAAGLVGAVLDTAGRQ